MGDSKETNLVIKVEKIDTFSGHRDCVYTLVAGSMPAEFFSAGGDGMVVKWNLQKPDLGEMVAQVPGSIYALAYDDQRNHLWVAENFEGIHLIDLSTKSELKAIKITSSAIFDIQFHENLALIALGDGTIVVMDKEHFVIKKHLLASEKSARGIAVNPLAKEFAVGYSDCMIRVFGIQDFDLRYTINAHTNSVFTVQYSPDYKYLLSGSRDAHLKSWSVWDNYEATHDVPAHLYAINHLVYNASASHFVTCSMDKSIKVWDAERFKLIKVIDRARYAGHGTSVNKLLWTSYQNLLVSCSDDRRISVWKIEV
ncbi:MAG: WD40 repeat domain-containing protein [Spirosomataceae bacterium]